MIKWHIHVLMPVLQPTRTGSISSVLAGVTAGHIPTFGATDRRELDFRAALCWTLADVIDI